MRVQRLFIMAGVCLATAAGGVSAQSTVQDKMPPHGDLPHGAADMPSTSAQTKDLSAQDAQTVQKLHESNVTEIEVGKLASKNAASAEVKRYGEMLVKDHTQADRELSALAKKKGVKLTDIDHSKLDDLRAMKGSQFDRAFLEKMEKDHKTAIELVRTAQGEAQNPEFRALLNKTLPVLQKHEEHATHLSEHTS
jgi:putative membrane protein